MVDQKDGGSRIVRSQVSKSGESESLNKLRSQPEKSRRREVQRQAGSVTRNQDKGRIHRNKEHGRAEDLPAVLFVTVRSLYRTFGASSRTGCTYTWRHTPMKDTGRSARPVYRHKSTLVLDGTLTAILQSKIKPDSSKKRVLDVLYETLSHTLHIQ